MAKKCDSRVGKRVELHPGTDRWMMGDRYGVIVGCGRGGSVRVKLDKSKNTIRLPGNRVEEI